MLLVGSTKVPVSRDTTAAGVNGAQASWDTGPTASIQPSIKACFIGQCADSVRVPGADCRRAL